jgi:NADH:ubiquinone oxidoreductase subunit F (NADH-binding)
MESKKQLRIATRNCGFIDPENIEDYFGVRGYEALATAVTAKTPADIIESFRTEESTYFDV